MRKIISLLLISISLLLISSCIKSETKKFGLGIEAYTGSVINAEKDTDGSVQTLQTAAAVLLGKGNRILDCKIDCIDTTLNFSSDGKSKEAKNLKSKYELGDDYNMVKYGGAKKEWYEQADIFCEKVKGKTLLEIKKSIAENGKGSEEMISAGCTIVVSDFVKALERAMSSAKKIDYDSELKVNLAIECTQSARKDADKSSDGVNQIDTTFSAALMDKSGKVVSMKTDALTAKYTFTSKGVLNTPADLKTKRKLKDAYGMVEYGGANKEWYLQADEFDKACIGKTKNGIAALVLKNGYAEHSLQKAGCTINISDMVKAAMKAAK